MVLRSFFKVPAQYEVGIRYSATTLLSYAIILLGFSLKAESLSQLEPSVFVALTVIVVSSILISLTLPRFLKTDKETSLLVGIGSGICGSAAISTCAGLVTSENSKVAASLGAINFAGVLGLFVLPIVATIYQLPAEKASLLIGGTLQSMGHVVAAADSLGAEILNSSITIKMGRVFLLIPTVICLGMLRGKKETSLFKKIPIYLWGFILVIILTNLPLLPDSLTTEFSKLGKWILLIAMVGVGYSINLRTLFQQVPKLIGLALIIQLVQILILLPFLT